MLKKGRYVVVVAGATGVDHRCVALRLTCFSAFLEINKLLGLHKGSNQHLVEDGCKECSKHFQIHDANIRTKW